MSESKSRSVFLFANALAIVRLALLLCASTLCAAPAVAAAAMPAAPFAIAEPLPPSRMWGETDLSEIAANELRATARRVAYEEHAYAQAIQLQHWAVEADPTTGVYALAGYYCLAGNLESATYWLQQAARGEGVYAREAESNADLAALVQSERWAKLNEYLAACSQVWAANTRPEEIIVVPTGYRSGAPLTAVIFLHGAYGSPAEIFEAEAAQLLADQTQVAIVAPSGPVQCGAASYAWPDDLAAGRARIETALSLLAKSMQTPPTQLIVLGYNTSASLALDLVGRDPKRYVGAIALSPVAPALEQKLEFIKVDGAPAPIVILTMGEKQIAADQRHADALATALSAAGAKIIRHTYRARGITWPPAFEDQLPIWLALLLAR